jgi:hypothetical protein
MAYFFMLPSRLQARLLQDAVESAGRQIVAGLAGDGDAARLGRVLELAVAAAALTRYQPSAFNSFSTSRTFMPDSLPRGRRGEKARQAAWRGPNARAKLPGPPARTLKREKPGWRPGSASAVGSALSAEEEF